MRVRKESAPISKRQLLDRMKQSKELNKTREIVCSYSKFQCNLGSTVCCKSLWDIFSEGCLEQLPTIEWAVKEHNADIRVITFFYVDGNPNSDTQESHQRGSRGRWRSPLLLENRALD